MDRDRLTALRGALNRLDGPGVMSALEAGLPEEVLQLVAEGLLVAVEAGTPGAGALAEACAGKLLERGWAGDGELAEELVVAIGARPPTGLEPLTVDLEQLSMLLETGMGEGGGVIDRRTGEVWTTYSMEYAAETEEDPPDFEDADRWLYVGPEGSRAGYRDMEDFLTMIDPDRADRLDIAIEGRGAFRRFKDTLARWPDDEERWYRFSGERQRGRAREWLREHGIRPIHGSGA